MSLEILARVTLILGAVLVGTLALRRASAAARHLVAAGGLAAALALPLLNVALPSWDLPILPPVREAATSVGVGPATTAERNAIILERSGSEPLAERAPAGRAKAPGVISEVESSLRVHSRVAPNWSAVGLGLWGLGGLIVLGRFARGWMLMGRLARSARPLDCPRVERMLDRCRETLGVTRRPRVLVSSSVRVPSVWGVRRPVLWLPATVGSWPAGRLRVVLLHELAHLRRLDGLSLVIGKLSTAVWWFHPLAWMVDRLARRDGERACDDLVLSCGERPSSYAAHLLDIVRELPARAAAPTPALAIASPGQLEKRLRSILNPGVRRGLSRPVMTGALALLAGAVAFVAMAEPVSRPDDRAEGRAATPVIEEAVEPAMGTFVVQATQPAGEERRIRRSERVLRTEREEIEQRVPRSTDATLSGERTYERALEAHFAEDFEEAVQGFEQAAREGYKVETSLYNAACGLARLGRTEEAVRTLRRALDAGGPDAIVALFDDADFDPIRREPAFRALVEELSESSELDRDPERHDRYAVAVASYEDLKEQDDAEPQEWEEVGLALLRLRDFERAIPALERAAEDTESPNTLYNLTCAYALSGEKDRAFELLEQAILAGFESEERMENDRDLDPLRNDSRFERLDELHWQLSLGRFDASWAGGSKYSKRRWAPAVEELTAFVAKHPEIGRAHYNLGWALHHSGEHERAAEAFERQLELGYRPDIATYNVACAEAMAGNRAAAFDWLARAVETGEFSPETLRGDQDLEGLADDPRFDDLLERADELNDDDQYVGKGLRKILRWVSGGEKGNVLR